MRLSIAQLHPYIGRRKRIPLRHIRRTQAHGCLQSHIGLHIGQGRGNLRHQKGNARLRDFSAVSLSDSLITGVDNAEFRFGTSDSFVRDEKRTDSLLTASLRIDSAYVVSSEQISRRTFKFHKCAAMYSLGDKPLHRHRRCRNRVRIYR